MSVSVPRSSAAATPEAPWLGLRPFTEDAQEYFFGREEELDELSDRIRGRPLTILFGTSGLGKSSLLQAALMPRLRAEGFLPVHVRFDHDPTAPSLESQLLDRLAHALAEGDFPVQAQAASATRDGTMDPSAALWLLFHDPLQGFAAPIEGVQPRPVVLIDQFEEIFTLGEQPKRREINATLRESLATLIENRPPAALRAQLEADDELADRVDYRAQPLRVLLSLREDFLHILERWRRSMPSLMENRLELRMLSGPQALEAVVQPGQRREGQMAIIPDEVGRAIVRFVAGVGEDVPLQEIDAVPPLLSLVCAELNAQRIAAGDAQITRTRFEVGRDDILKSFYERSFDPASYGGLLGDQSDGESALGSLRNLIEAKLLSSDGFRENIAFDTIQRDLSQIIGSETSRTVLDAIVERRLLTVEERGGVRRLELAHDVLTRIVKVSRDEREEKEAVSRAQREKEDALSKAAEIRLQRNRLRRWVIVAAVCAVVAAAGAIFGWLGLLRANRSAAQAERSAAEAKRSAAEAEFGFSAARKTTDEFLGRMAGEDLGFVPGIQDLREQMARDAVAQYQNLLERKPDDPSIRMALLGAELSHAEMLTQIGSVAEVDKAFKGLFDELAMVEQRDQTEELNLLDAKARLDYQSFLTNEYDFGERTLIDTAIRKAESVKSPGNRIKGAIQLMHAYNMLGNVAKERSEKIRWYSTARSLGLPLLEEVKDDPMIYHYVSGCTANLGRQYQWSDKKDEQTEGLKLMDEADELANRALAIKPDSPNFIYDAELGLQQRGEALANVGRYDEARAVLEKAVAQARRLMEVNPRVSDYRYMLAYILKNYGDFSSKRQEFAQARQQYREAVGLYETVIAQRDDRPSHGADLLDALRQLSDFEQFGKGADNKNADSNPTAAAEIREKGIKLGRELVKKYPDSVTLSYNLLKLLANHATYEPVKGDDPKAIALFEEGVNLMEKQFLQNRVRISTDQAEGYLGWVSTLDDLLKKQAEKSPQRDAGFKAKRAALLDGALQWRPICNDYESKQQLLLVGNHRCDLLLEAGQADRVVELNLGLIAFAESAYKEKPYYYYFRDSFGGQYKYLAKAYQMLGDKPREFGAWQDWIKIFVIPQYGSGYDDLVSSNYTVTDDNLKKLRAVADHLPKTKMFVIPCDVNGVKIPVQFFINNAIPGPNADPLADQARWIKEERGVTVTEDVRDSIRKLAEIAHENKLGFADLCDYALNYKEDNKKNTPAKSSKPEGSAADIPQLEEGLKKVDEARKNLTNENSDENKLMLAGALGNAAFDAIFQKRFQDSVLWSNEALQLIANTEPATQPKARAALVFIYGNLAHGLLFTGKYNEALKIYRAHLNEPMDEHTFKDAVVDDYALFDKAGLTHPDLSRMKKALGISPIRK